MMINFDDDRPPRHFSLEMALRDATTFIGLNVPPLSRPVAY
jgi:hypothetical protein